MAKCAHGTLAGAVSGSVGAETYLRGRYGGVVRPRVRGVVHRTAYAVDARGRFCNEAIRWRDLREQDRAAWETWARVHPVRDSLGQSQVVSGHVAFCGVNARLTQAGDTRLDWPGVGAEPRALVSLSGVWDIGAGFFQVIWLPTPVSIYERVWIRAWVGRGAATEFVENRLKVVKITEKGASSNIDVQADIEARFGALIAGQKIVVVAAVFDSRTGLLGQPRRTSGIVVST